MPIVNVGKVPDSDFPANINIDDIIMFHSALLGITGCGKTFLAYHLIEEAIKRGVKVVAIDVSGDYRRYLRDGIMLRDLNQLSNFLDSSEQTCAIIEPESNIQHPVKAANKIAHQCLEWCKENRGPDDILHPEPKLLLVFEEAHVLIPEWNFINDAGLQKIVNDTARIGLQARKFGLGFMVISQRTANVTKSILNQCNSIFAFQAFDETGFDFMRNYLGNHYVGALPNLRLQRCVLTGKASLSARPLIIDIHTQDREPSEEPLPEYAIDN